MALLALSLSSQVEKIGAYAGFASILGLAVLALLYFAQAREVKRLRDWAGGAPERARREEERVAAEAEATRATGPAAAPRVVAAPTTGAATAAEQPTTVGRAEPAPRRPPSARPPGVHTGYPAGAPAGLGAPALASATPSPALALTAGAPAAAAPAPAAGGPAPSPAPTTTAPDPAPAPPASAPPAEPAPAATPPPDAALPAALTAAAATRNRPAPPPGASATSAPAAENGHGTSPPRVPPPRAGAQARPAPAAALRSDRPSATLPPRTTAPPGPNPGARRWALAGLVVGLLVLAGVVFGITQLIGHKSDSGTTTSGTKAASVHRGAGARTFGRGKVTVAVLNGTPQSGLAKQVADRLVADGFKQGAVTNASDQARSATIISYFPGHKADALAIRKALKLGATEPVDPTTQGIVCPAGKACKATVVVTVGSDLPPR